MVEYTYLTECHFCGEESEIYTEGELGVDYCPFCGEPTNAIELDSDG